MVVSKKSNSKNKVTIPSEVHELPPLDIVKKKNRPGTNIKLNTVTTPIEKPDKPVYQVKQLSYINKRKLSYNLKRVFQKYELLLDKVLNYFIDKDLLLDPVRQNLLYNLEHNRIKNESIIRIVFNSDLEVNQVSIVGDLRKKIKNSTVLFGLADENQIVLSVHLPLPAKG